MIIQPSTKLSTQTLIALLALAAGCAPGVAMDYRDNYGNNSYYGNNSGYDNDNYNSNNDGGGMGDSSHRHHHKHLITGNECSNDAVAGANCGASP